MFFIGRRRSLHYPPTKTPKTLLLHLRIMMKIVDPSVQNPIRRADLICVPNTIVYGHLINRALESSNKT